MSSPVAYPCSLLCERSALALFPPGGAGAFRWEGELSSGMHGVAAVSVSILMSSGYQRTSEQRPLKLHGRSRPVWAYSKKKSRARLYVSEQTMSCEFLGLNCVGMLKGTGPSRVDCCFCGLLDRQSPELG